MILGNIRSASFWISKGSALLASLLTAASLAAGNGTVVLEGGRLFDPRSKSEIDTAAIVIRGDRIESVIEKGARYDRPEGAQVIDASGRFIVPGLIDAHTHLNHVLRSAHVTADEILPLYLACGITSVRDVGDDVVPQRILANRAEAHPELSPRIFLASPLIDGARPYHKESSVSMTDPAAVPAFVDDMAAWGVRTFKIYVGTQRPVGKAVIEAAHQHGLWVTAHLGKYRPQDAVPDGIDCLEHIASVFDYVLPPNTPEWPALDERGSISPAHLQQLWETILAAKAALDLDSPRVRELIDLIVSHRTFVDPTLVVFRNWMLLSDSPDVLQHPDNAAVPGRLRRMWFSSVPRSDTTAANRKLREQAFAKMLELTGRLHRAGVTLLAGTDAPVQFCPPGGALLQELELLVEAGLTPADALAAATINNAHAVQESDTLGVVAPGRAADLVILDADPLADIRNMRRIHRVIHSGRICDPAALRALVPAE